MPPSGVLRVALLHLEPRTGDLSHNCNLIETAARAAAAAGAGWIVTPELCVSGYLFSAGMGTDWIKPHPDLWTARLCRLAAELRITLFLGHQERDPQTGEIYNAVFVLGPHGTILGKHRKVNVVKVCEGWSLRGEDPMPVLVDSLSVGMLICADSWTPDVARGLKDRGAQILVSPSSWPPRPHGPEGCWESRSRETGLPLFVCNRTGIDGSLDCRDAQSVVVHHGELLVAFQSDRSSIVFVDWNLETNALAGHRSVEVKIINAEKTADLAEPPLGERRFRMKRGETG